MQHKMTIHRRDEEHVEILIDGESLGSANHDNEGWAGMETVESLAVNIADKLGMEIVETFGDEEPQSDVQAAAGGLTQTALEG